MKRTTGLSRTGFRTRARQPIEKVSAVEAEIRTNLALAFHDAAQRPWCAICHEPRTEPLHAHHWVEHSFLRRELKNRVDPLRMEAIAFDVRNQSGVCERCHGAHHGPSVQSPLTQQHIPESAYEFAKELDTLTGTEKFTVRLEMYRA